MSDRDTREKEIQAAFSEIRSASSRLASEATDPEILLKLATILDYDNQSRKTQADIRSLERTEKTETIRFFVPIVAPLVSALAVVAALVFQTFQFRANTRLQQATVEIQRDSARIQAQAAEDAQWRQVASTISAGPSALNGITGTALLLPFIRRGSHVEEARTLAASLLRRTVDYEGFSSLYGTVLDPTPPQQRLALSIRLARSLNDAYLEADAHTQEIHGSPSKFLSSLPDYKGQQVPNPYWILAQLDREVALVASTVVDSLRTKSSAPSLPLDLSGCALWNTDGRGVVFPQADIRSSSFSNSDFTGADLTNLSTFDESFWARTAWWRAKSVSPDLLAYLEKNYPLNTKSDYAGGNATSNEYQEQLTRLSSQR